MIPNTINTDFLDQLKKTLRKHYKEYKFVLVCGGGAIARTYIQALRHEHKSEKELSLAGIRVTRMNALLLMQYFGKEVNSMLPKTMKDVENNLKKNNVVICGALRYAPKSTSDGTAAKLAHLLKAIFINITNVPGLYTEDPKKNPKAKFIAHESWKAFEQRAKKMKYTSGQHFVLDQQAATLIRKYHIPTFIIGKDMNNFERCLTNKSWKGTRIQG